MAANTLKIVSLTSRVELVWAVAQQLSKKDARAIVTTRRKELLRTGLLGRVKQVLREPVYEGEKPERKSAQATAIRLSTSGAASLALNLNFGEGKYGSPRCGTSETRGRTERGEDQRVFEIGHGGGAGLSA